MRIAVLAPFFPPEVGGAENGALRLVQRLGARHRVVVWTASHVRGSNGAAVGIEPTFAVDRHPRFAGGDGLGWQRPPGLPWVRANLVVASRVRRFRPDVVLTFYAIPYGLASVSARALGCPVVLSLVGRDVDQARPIDKKVMRAMLRAASRLILISRYARDRLEGSIGRRVSCDIIPLGVERTVGRGTSADRETVRRRWGIDREAFVVFALQRLSPVKRFDVVIEAMPLVLDRRSDVHLVVGGTGRELDRLRELAARLGVSEHVRFLGFVPDGEVRGHYAAADLFAFHSTFETLGLSVIEAMMAGLPVVCADETGAAEAVHECGGGVVARPLDPADVAGRIVALAADPALRDRLAERGRRAAEGTFGWDVVARRYEGVLERAAARG